MIKILWLCLAGLLSQNWLHPLFLALRNSLEVVYLFFPPIKRLRVKPISYGHASLADEMLPLAILDDLLAPWARQLLFAELQDLSLL